MESDQPKASSALSTAKEFLLQKNFGPMVTVYSDEIKSQLARLDDDELKVLVSIKEKLNAGLTERLKAAVDAVGVIVW